MLTVWGGLPNANRCTLCGEDTPSSGRVYSICESCAIDWKMERSNGSIWVRSAFILNTYTVHPLVGIVHLHQEGWMFTLWGGSPFNVNRLRHVIEAKRGNSLNKFFWQKFCCWIKRHTLLLVERKMINCFNFQLTSFEY